MYSLWLSLVSSVWSGNVFYLHVQTGVLCCFISFPVQCLVSPQHGTPLLHEHPHVHRCLLILMERNTKSGTLFYFLCCHYQIGQRIDDTLTAEELEEWPCLAASRWISYVIKCSVGHHGTLDHSWSHGQTPLLYSRLPSTVAWRFSTAFICIY